MYWIKTTRGLDMLQMQIVAPVYPVMIPLFKKYMPKELKTPPNTAMQVSQNVMITPLLKTAKKTPTKRPNMPSVNRLMMLATSWSIPLRSNAVKDSSPRNYNG
jgi:hypothetical protein